MPQRLLGGDLRAGLLHPVRVVRRELVGKLHQQLIGENLRLAEDPAFVRRPLIGPQFRLQPEHVGLEEEVAVGILAAQQAVEVVGVEPLAVEEVGVGLGHDAVVGERAAGVVDAHVVVGLQGPAPGVE